MRSSSVRSGSDESRTAWLMRLDGSEKASALSFASACASCGKRGDVTLRLEGGGCFEGGGFR